MTQNILKFLFWSCKGFFRVPYTQDSNFPIIYNIESYQISIDFRVRLQCSVLFEKLHCHVNRRMYWDIYSYYTLTSEKISFITSCSDVSRYLSLLATCPLGFNDNVRCAVEEAICDETNGLPRADCFDLAVNTVFAFLRKTYLVPFLSSQHYVHMLSDLIRNSSTIFNHSPSSSISEYSIDSKKACLTEVDPDLMWHRRKRRFNFNSKNTN